MFKSFNIRLLLAIALSMFVFDSCQQDKSPEFLQEAKKRKALSEFEGFLQKDFIPNAPAFKKQADDFLMTPAVYNPVSKTASYSQVQKSQAKILLNPMFVASKKLLKAYDFTTKDLPKGIDESAMVLLGLVVFAAEKKKEQQLDKAGFLPVVLVLDIGEKVINCIGRAALGFSLQDGWESLIKQMSKRTLIRVIGRIAVRTLGWIGAALIAYDIVDCFSEI